MQLSLEFFLLINFSLDALLLAIVSKSIGSFRMRRIFFTATLCTIFALLAVCGPGQWRSPLLQIILLLPVSMMAADSSDIRNWGPGAVMLITGILLAGGCERLFFAGDHSEFHCISAGISALILLFCLLYRRKSIRNTWSIHLCVSANGSSVRFTALIDTGNRLHEPLSGLPVIIAEEEILKDILPDKGYRKVAYGGLGGNGTLNCFRPDFIWIKCGSKHKKAPAAWVAVSPLPLPGMYAALAPCEFAAL